MAETFFNLPTNPQDIGVILPDSDLRRIDFSGLDYDTARRAIIEYIQTYYPDEFNDFVANNGVMMIMEILASVTDKLSLRSDVLANESIFASARTEEAVVNHLALINQRIKRQTPAVVDVECSVDFPLTTELRIPAGTSFSLSAGNNTIYYEVFAAPNDYASDIVIPAGKRGVIAWGIEGRFASASEFVSSGDVGQEYTVIDANILEEPILVNIQYGADSEDWRVIYEPIERYGSNDKVVEVYFVDNRMVLKFGDNITGASPKSGSVIRVRYRKGGGKVGRIGAGQISESKAIKPQPPANASVSVNFRNITPSSGGTDKESLKEAKRRAPRDYATQGSIVTASDYAQFAESFSHPSYGSISKAVATVRTSLNTNLVEVYTLAQGPDDIPVAPNSGLKAGLKTYFEDLNVLTDYVEILDGHIKPIDIDMSVVVNRNADASIIKERMEALINNYFRISNWDMGQSFYVSNFIETIESLDGVAYVDLFEPAFNILSTNQLKSEDSDGVGINEVIVQGTRKVSYYYERINRQ